MIHQHQDIRRLRVLRWRPWCSARAVRDCVPVTQVMKVRMVAAWGWSCWVVRTKECPQSVQRQRVVPLLVVPFFLVVWLHTGQRGRFVVTAYSQSSGPSRRRHRGGLTCGK